ncbi:hypothetical protein T08_9531 [Trichinella sp. T8]|nr:hypothetical protein T08_9531 [Trichinella sp. T8]
MPLKIIFEKVPFYKKCHSFYTNKIFPVLLVESVSQFFDVTHYS